MIYLKKKSQKGKILIAMSKKPNKWFKVVDFQKPIWIQSLPFIGYEAGTRIGDLVRKGYVEKRNSEDGSRFMEYRILGAGAFVAMMIK